MNKKTGPGHQLLVGEQHRGCREKKDGQGSVSWDHRGRNVSQRYEIEEEAFAYNA